MWKLAITQKRKSEYSDHLMTEAVEFVSDDINELTILIDRLTALETAVETAYMIVKA